MTLNDNLFSQSYDQIVKGAMGDGQQYFQMLGSPKDFVFGTAPTGQTNAEAYQIVSGMPHWSPIGSFGIEDAKFASTYKQVFQNITWKVSPSQEQAQKDAKNNVNQKDRDLTEASATVNSAYLAQKQNGGAVFAAQYPTMQDWLAGPGSAYNKAVVAAQASLDQAIAQREAITSAAQSPTLQQAQAAANPPKGNPATDPTPQGWTKVQDMGGIIRWQPEFTIGQSGEDWRGELSNGTIGEFTVTLHAADGTSDLNKSWAGGSAGYDNFFWGVSGSGGWEKMDLTESDHSVTATIHVKSSTTVDVTPGDWYDGGFMKQLAASTGHGYTLDPPMTATGNAPAMFGAEGLLSTRVGQLVVVYQPSFEITMSSSTFEKHHEKFEAGGGVRIGPFHFGGHGGHESTYTHETDGDTRFVGGSTSTDPLIIGVNVAFPGINKPA